MTAPNFQTVRLEPGAHSGPDHGVCVMELSSMLAGEPFSDHPCSVSKPLAALLRGYNDGLDDARRQTLKVFAAASVGTGGNRAADRRRRALARHWVVEWRGGRGLRARLARRWGCVDLIGAGAQIGFRVRTQHDDELHAQMLELLHALVAVDAGGPPVLAPAAEVAGEVLAR